jgi:hypothetical protein
VYVDAETQLGNSINNQSQFQGDFRFNMETLYNKSKFLKSVNRQFSSSNRRQTNVPKNGKTPERKKYNQRIQLKPDTTIIVKHNLDNKNIKVKAFNAKNEQVSVKYQVKDKNSIIIQTRGTESLKLTVTQGKRPEEETWYKIMQYSVRGLMMVRNMTLNYRHTSSTYLPSFRPNVGDFLGQNNGDVMAPGLGFAFGVEGGESFINKAIDNNWLIVSDSLTTPAVMSTTDDFQYKVSLEPITGLKIDLNGSRVSTRSNQYQFMFKDIPMQRFR